TPALGVGWMVAPSQVAAAVLEYREATGTRPSPAGQRVLAELARHGDLGRHLRKLRRELSERRSLVSAALTSAGIPVLGDDAGAHLVVPCGSAADEAARMAAAERAGIRLDGLARHFAGTPTVFGTLIGYAGCSREALRSALEPLIAVLG
ncbi:MAG TPA: aminotransferase class I/II-fold pyridoxal phosphate-dependent enzyme, partial [Amycolatopsis sp.]|nr:aminotransferase class I/II-fold pyridoxal phosphate-dependent enzyme [Amycolatopsis sp.]